MQITKRDGRSVEFDIAKITKRISLLCNGYGFLSKIDETVVKPVEIAEKVSIRMYDNISSARIDELAAQIAASMTSYHPQFGDLALRIAVNNLHKETPNLFSDAMEILYNNRDSQGEPSPLVSDQFINLVRNHRSLLNEMVNSQKDYHLDYFGFMTLSKAYLLRVSDVIIERPQYMWLRTALAIHEENFERVMRTYLYMSNRFFTHATPTLFHAGTNFQQLSSCFLLGTEDTVQGIYKSVSDMAMISKWAGGLGLHLSNVRCRGSPIRSTGRQSDGIVPLLRVLNNTARYINQSGRRNGSFAIYLEPWHGDILDFLEAKKNRGNEEERARDLFYALWIPDLFMKRVEQDEKWSLMCPDACPGLCDTHSDEFETLYLQYEREGKAIRQLPARDVFKAIMESQIETGTPYMLYKDACNRKSNQANLGCIKSSNLCAEIVEYSDSKEYAVCNLASVAIHQFVDPMGHYNYRLLGEVVEMAIENLDIIIDKNHYPVPETQTSNFRHRPVGLGVQGLADVYFKMGFAFDSPEAREMNRLIFETIYYHALRKSHELAVSKGAYSTFQGSPLSNGEFQFDLWSVQPTDRYDWAELREKIKRDGIRNSQLIALMPTASTSQILGSNECIEPYTSNVYVRRTLAGEFTVVNNHLVRDLMKLDLWTPELRQQLLQHRGSVQKINEIPSEIRERYKTAWEIRQKELLDQAAERGPFVCQSQSLNIFLRKPTINLLYSIHLHGWRKGLKTGSYYIRTAPAADMQQFTVVPGGSNGKTSQDTAKPRQGKQASDFVCQGEEGCLACSG